MYLALLPIQPITTTLHGLGLSTTGGTSSGKTNSKLGVVGGGTPPAAGPDSLDVGGGGGNPDAAPSPPGANRPEEEGDEDDSEDGEDGWSGARGALEFLWGGGNGTTWGGRERDNIRGGST